MRCAKAFLGVCFLLAVLPAGALAGTPLWTHSISSDIADLSLTPDGSFILVGGDRLCLLTGNGTLLWREWAAGLIACSADGRLIAGAAGPSLILFNRDATVVWRQDLPSTPVDVVLFPGGERVVAADRFGGVYFYDIDGTLRTTVDTRGDPDDGIEAFSEIHDVALSGKGEYVAVISSRGLFYYTGAGRKVWAREDSLAGGTAVAVSGTGNEIAAASDANIRLLNRTGATLWVQRCPRPVTALAIAQDGSRIVFGLQDNTLTCLDRKGGEVWTFAADGWIRGVAVSQNGSRVLAGSMDGRAYLFDGAGRLLETYTLGDWVNHVALTADGTVGVAASLHEVIGISAVAATPSPTATTTTLSAATPSLTAATSSAGTSITTPENATSPPTEEGGDPPFLVLGLFACSVTVGAGFFYLRRREAPLAMDEESLPIVDEEVPTDLPPAAVEVPLNPWHISLDEGRTREAARLLSREMTTLIQSRTGSRIVTAADALAACPGEREALARFFTDADRLAYGHGDPAREDIEALEVAYLRLVEEIRSR